MGIREKMNDNPAVTTGVTAGIILLALVFIIYQLSGGGSGGVQGSGKAYFTDDDGKTLFADDAKKIPPFDHNGKQAVKAYAFSIDGGKTHWVQYLERYTPEVKKKMEEQMKLPLDKQDFTIMETLGSTGIEVKAPGAPDKEWTTQKNYQKWAKIVSPKSPDGKTGEIVAYLP